MRSDVHLNGNVKVCLSPWDKSYKQSKTYYVDHGCQEVDEDGDEDDDVSRRVRLVDPTAGLPQNQRQTLVVLRSCDQNQAGVEDDED